MAEGVDQGPFPPDQPERDYWLLSEATGEYHDHATEGRVYVFPDGMRHIVPDHVAVASKDDLRNIHVRKMGVPVATGTLKNSWKPIAAGMASTGIGVDRADTMGWNGTVAAASGIRSMDEMRVIAGTQTPRQWLDHRVLEIAEQGRL